MSGRLEPYARQTDVVIDWLGVLLSAGAIVLLTVAANGSSSWGLVLAKPDAPFARQKRQSRTGYLSNGAIPTRAVARSIAGSSRVKPPALRRRGPNYHR
jgi:hypothetical protein